MNAKRKPLGRNLDALMRSSRRSDTAEKNLRELPIDQIEPGEYQPRSVFDTDKLESLAASIRANGVVQPVVVRRRGDGYELIAGDRRWRAAQLAGLDALPAVIREVERRGATSEVGSP